jgi:hypothetical protein
MYCYVLHLRAAYNLCFASGVCVEETKDSITFRYKKIPDTILTNEADTPTWCPKGLK